MADDPAANLPETEDGDEGGPIKSFLEHLEDLRWVLIKSVVALGLAMLLCLIAGNYVVEILKWPLTRAKVGFPGTNQVVTVLFGTNQLGIYQLKGNENVSLGTTNRFVAVRVEPATVGTNQVLTWRVDPDPEVAARANRMHVDLINLSPASGFFVAFQVAFYGGMVLACPFIFFYIASFVFPALRMREKFYIYRALGFGLTLFLAGVSFCYFVLMPVALAASQSYSQWLGFAAFQWKADEYISFVCKFMLGMGLGFEMPVIILTLVKIGVLNYSILSRARRYMIVINLVLGAVLTTPEVITQILMAVPLQMLYEASVWIAWYWERKDKKRKDKKRKAAEEAAEAAGLRK
jgi:sec-independent protein translocase protein TatC